MFVYYRYSTSITQNWTAFAPAPGTNTATGYELDASTMATFAPLWTSSTTASVSLSTLTVGGVTPLTPYTTYYLRVGALNSNNVPNFGITQSTQTTAGGAVTSSTITARSEERRVGKSVDLAESSTSNAKK